MCEHDTLKEFRVSQA